MVVLWSYLHALGFSHADLFRVLEQWAISDDTIWWWEDNFAFFLQKILKNLPITPEKKLKIQSAHIQLSIEVYSLKLQNSDIRICLHSDPDFPEALHSIASPIFLLYVRGNLEPSRLRIAIVGSREATPYGEQAVASFVPRLAQAGITIVSGGALGIDILAHQATIYSQGHTIVVLGSGIDVPYPRSHFHIFEKIVKSGSAIVSQFPLWYAAAPYTFPQRNEVIAGLARGIVVIEAKERSGSLITAQLGLEMGKDIFAIPSDISRKNSLGANRLIQNASAKLLISPDDLLQEYGITPQAITKHAPSGSRLEQHILSILDGTAHTVDGLADALQVRVDEIQIELGKMEIFGTITRNNFGQYSLNHG